MIKRQPFYTWIGTWIYPYFVRLRNCLQNWIITLKNYLFRDEDKEEKHSTPLAENIYHKNRIMALGCILKNKCLSLEKRGQAALKIGLLANTGGPEAEKLAAKYMKDVADLLQNYAMTPKTKILLLKSLSCWFYLNPFSQRKAHFLNFVFILTSLLKYQPEPPTQSESENPLLVKFWACYDLYVMTCANLPIVKELEHYSYLRYHLQMLSMENWVEWPENYACELASVIGFYK